MAVSPILIADPTDVRLAPYRNLRERTLRGESIFIAEGSLVTERLLRSRYAVESVLISSQSTNRDDILALVPEDVPVYLADAKAIADQVVGFEFHQGILAVGRRGSLPSFEEGVLQIAGQNPGQNQVYVVLPRATKPDNLGLAFRASAALGATAVVLGEQCCDPFSRRALRVSMGGVLQLPVFRARSLEKEISHIKADPNTGIFATVLDPTSRSLFDCSAWPRRTIFLFGNEYDGLSESEIAWADTKVIIPIRQDVDSLNLGVSVGIFLYEWQKSHNIACH